MFSKIKIFFFFFTIILIGVAVLASLSYFGQKPAVQASPGDSASTTGWAWIGGDCTNETDCGAATSPIGWISFNASNTEITCAGVPYRVSVDYGTGEISGAAWIGVGENNVYTDCNTTENTIGWLYFDYTATDWPGGVLPSYDFPAQIVDDEIQGWAPIITRDQTGSTTTLTWVRFKGTNYSVRINADGTIGTSTTDHYAWAGLGADGGLGWIDFSPTTTARVKFPKLNRPPNKPKVPAAGYPDGETWDHCGGLPTVALRTSITFHWDYSDPDGDPQSAYEVWVTTSTEPFDSGLKFNHKVNSASNAYSLNLSEDDDGDWLSKLAWNGNYKWKVRVWDSHNSTSSWSDVDTFTMPSHAYPSPSFKFEDRAYSVGEVVTFTDDSRCYRPDETWYRCGTDAYTTTAYSWDFGDGSPTRSDKSATTTHAYTAAGKYTVSLSVTDNLGTCTYDLFDKTGKKVKVGISLPEWKEIAPFQIIIKLLYYYLVELLNAT